MIDYLRSYSIGCHHAKYHQESNQSFSRKIDSDYQQNNWSELHLNKLLTSITHTVTMRRSNDFHSLSIRVFEILIKLFFDYRLEEFTDIKQIFRSEFDIQSSKRYLRKSSSNSNKQLVSLINLFTHHRS